ncbi:MAG: prepilin peptidase [Hyphomicrobiales bacterium]
MISVPPVLALIFPLAWGITVAVFILRDRFSAILTGISLLSCLLVMLSFQNAFANNASLVLALASGILSTHLIGLALIDARISQVPDILTLPFIATGLLHAWIVLDSLLAHGITAITLGGTVLAAKWVAQRAAGQASKADMFGSGDVLMVTGLGAWLGPFGTGDALILSVGITLFAMMCLRRRQIPFAPGLAIGTWSVWLLGPIISAQLFYTLGTPAI